MRPYILIGSIICAIAGPCKFFIPAMPNAARLVWVYFFNILFMSIGVALVNLKHNLQTLGTRKHNDRMQVNLFAQISAYLLVGVAISLVVGSVLYYTMLHGYPAINWIILVTVIAIISLPLSIIQYYYTKERVTLEYRKKQSNNENKADENKKEKMPIGKQIKALFTCKNYILAIAITGIMTIANSLVGANLSTNFCTVILGANAVNNYNFIYTVASDVPLGLGILLIYPISKKFTIRKTTMLFGLIAIAGCIMGLFVKQNFWLVVIANFIFNFGTLPMIYVIGTLTISANDEVEYKHNFRVEGIVAADIIAAVIAGVTVAFSGLYETGLTASGYNAALEAAQPESVFSWLYFIRYGVPSFNIP